MKIIDSCLLDFLSKEAIVSERLRMNYNFHNSHDSKAQRLLNALEPGTVIPIHRHPNTDETYILLRGKLKVTIYKENKEIEEEFFLDPQTGNYGIHISAGQWHSLEVFEKKSVIFEVKDGPYTPLTPENIL